MIDGSASKYMNSHINAHNNSRKYESFFKSMRAYLKIGDDNISFLQLEKDTTTMQRSAQLILLIVDICVAYVAK